VGPIRLGGEPPFRVGPTSFSAVNRPCWAGPSGFSPTSLFSLSVFVTEVDLPDHGVIVVDGESDSSTCGSDSLSPDAKLILGLPENSSSNARVDINTDLAAQWTLWTRSGLTPDELSSLLEQYSAGEWITKAPCLCLLPSFRVGWLVCGSQT